MFETNFIHFSDNPARCIDRDYDGYLAFLPEPAPGHTVHSTDTHHDAAATTQFPYRLFSGKDFCWFEFKDTQPSTGLGITFNAPDRGLWLLLNMRAEILLTLESSRSVPRDVLLCYQTLVDTHAISLADSSTWFLLLGINGNMLQELTTEYATLKSLFTIKTGDDSPQRIIGTMSLHAKLRLILDSLQQMQFRPFSTYYQLANWNIRLFERVFQELSPQSVEKTDHEVELYHKAIAYIRKNFYDDQLNNNSIAKALHVTQRTLERAFKDKPFTVTEQIIEFRLQEARVHLRNSDTPIATIAGSLNFACPKNFKRLFTKRFMISPLQYRERMHVTRLF